MGLLSFIGDIFKPAAELVDNLHTSKEEKLSLVNQLAQIENNVKMKTLEIQSELIKAQSQVIVAEAQGQSWMQRNGRPLTMLVFLGLVVLDSFAILANPLSKEAWTLLQIGLGGYVLGRSYEKSKGQV